MRLSVLDQSPIREGGTATEAVRETIALARAVDAMGYHRYWLAEHHDSNGLACAAPEVLIPQVAAETRRIRVGSGGVMLSHYSPLKVAEVFRMLETLHPGRIDLGIGRAPGSSHHVANALAFGPGAVPLEQYPHQVADLVGYLANDLPEGHPFFGIQAQPAGAGQPEMWMLGSSLESAQIAAALGLPYSYAHFINPEAGARAIALYRERYEPSTRYPEPRVSAGVSALCAPTEEEAVQLSWSRYCMRFRRLGVPSVETALAFDYSPAELDYIVYSRSRAAIGDPAMVKARLEALATELDVDELVLLTITYDFAHRVRSYELIAEAFGLEAEHAVDRVNSTA
ncbi:MAG: LLM class flavin-dependent oxidoreductase [Chloroflexi bacterium]|nr:LLM class flavin-dependent oxidoreductase [Chloroflexota bacterium]MDA1145187.1 LLM class flavin-dependent oxidoreductase [Chloroflexota bacterium]